MDADGSRSPTNLQHVHARDIKKSTTCIKNLYTPQKKKYKEQHKTPRSKMATTYSTVTPPSPYIKISYATPKIKWSNLLAICSTKQSTLETFFTLIQVIQVIHLRQVRQVRQTFCILAERARSFRTEIP
jgi:hypothetical protein